MTTHRLPPLFVLAGALIALPQGASSLEATVARFIATPQTVTTVVPDDGDCDVASKEMTPLTDAIVSPVGGAAPIDRTASDISRRPARPPEPVARPPGLVAMYAGFATLQALDAHSTLQAVRSGYQESNPVVGLFSQSPAAMYAFKAATTTATILVVEKLRKRHRGAAIGLMVAANVGYAMIVAHNYSRSRN